MRLWSGVVLVTTLLASAATVAALVKTDEKTATKYVTELDEQFRIARQIINLAQWNYETNITKANEAILEKTQVDAPKRYEKLYKETMNLDWRNFTNATLKWWLDAYNFTGAAALPTKQFELLQKTIHDMQTTQAAATICDYKNRTKCDLSLNPDIIQIFATSTDPEELKYTFVEWHRAAGAAIKANFTQYVTLKNLAANLNGLKSAAEWWLSDYDTPNIEAQFLQLWKDFKPLYLQLHAYVRRKLREKYGASVVSARGPIPAHLVGDIYTRNWGNIEKFTRPYPSVAETDVTKALRDQNYTVLKIVQMSDKFQQSLNLTAMPATFYKNSIFEKPNDGRVVNCDSSAWDMHDGKDFRMKMCATVDYDYYKTTHHEMGHVQNFLQYRFQPYAFHGGANSGFEEAIGDVFILSVISPDYLKRVGLIKNADATEQALINQLYKVALDKVAFPPYGYLLDIWRYGIFRATTTTENINCHFWSEKETLQGLEPPVTRTEKDFDGGAKSHVADDVEYMRYFVAYMIQFQFHKALCQLAGQYNSSSASTKKLVNCDIYNSAAAGNAFAKMLQMGSSKTWPNAMEVLTGQREMSASGIKEYFDPLYKWLVAENNRTKEYIGWEPSKVRYCTDQQKAAGLPKVGG